MIGGIILVGAGIAALVGIGVATGAAAEIINSVESVVMRGLRILFYTIDQFIYDLMIKLYKMFETLCTVRLLSTDLMSSIARRIGVILGLVMLFYVVLAFVKMLVDPDKVNDKDNGGVAVIKRVLIVIVMLGVSNFVFDTLFEVQKTLIQSGAISKLFLPVIPSDTITELNNSKFNEDGEQADDSRTLKQQEAMIRRGGGLFEHFGGLLAEETFYAFYHINDEIEIINDESSDGSGSVDYENLVNYCRKIHNKFREEMISDNPSFSLGSVCLNEMVPTRVVNEDKSYGTGMTYLIDYNFLLATGAGIAIVYFLLMYCIQVGIRMIQIMVLEIISPMAIISFLSPKKDNMFSKWTSIYFSTYIDVFIRVAIINLVVLVISALFSTGKSFEGFAFWDSFVDLNKPTRYFYIVIMILALMAFAKKAPDLIKEFVPKGKSGLGFGSMKMKDFFGLGTTLGAAAGAGMELLHGNPIGMLGGAFRGGKAGFGSKGIFSAISSGGKAERDHRNLVRDIRDKEGSYLGYMRNKIGAGLGFQTDAERYDTRIQKIKNNVEAEQAKVKTEKNRTANIRRQSASRTKAQDIIKKINDRAKEQVLTRDVSGNHTLENLQHSLLAKKTEIEQMQNTGMRWDPSVRDEQGNVVGGYRHAEAADIADAITRYNAQLEDAAHTYTSVVYGNGSIDRNMSGLMGDLQTLININEGGAFDGVTIGHDIGNYEDLHAFDGNISQVNNAFSGDIARSDAIIAGYENTIAGYEAEIANIQDSSGYKASQGNKPRNS